MHGCYVPVAYGVMDVLVGYPSSKRLNGEAFVWVFYISIGWGEPLDVVADWLTLILDYRPQADQSPSLPFVGQEMTHKDSYMKIKGFWVGYNFVEDNFIKFLF